MFKYALYFITLFFLSAVNMPASVEVDTKISTYEKKAPMVLVIFGATGDLSSRKLFPALYQLSLAGELPQEFACIAFARREHTDESFRSEVQKSLKTFSRTDLENDPEKTGPEKTASFLQNIHYNTSAFDEDDGYLHLKEMLAKFDAQYGKECHKVFYLATPAQFFPIIAEKLSLHEIVTNDNNAQVLIEKPFGFDLTSALSLRDKIHLSIPPQQVGHIDHFLGKEGVQNILNLRFANPIYDAIWNCEHIENVQITIAEDIGIGTRGAFWEETGLLRDIVQNHLMQILSLVAMEHPERFDALHIQKEKLKVVRSIRPFPLDDLENHIVRGQYSAGEVTHPEEITHASLVGYREEKAVSTTSAVETYVAAKLFIDTPRWKNIPFYIRAGKRLKEKKTEVVITFKQPQFARNAKPNKLVLRIQPEEYIYLTINGLTPGFNNQDLGQYTLKSTSTEEQNNARKDAYEYLFRDAIAGDKNNFVTFEELLASWELFSPVLQQWNLKGEQDLLFYPAGSNGPDVAHLFEKAATGWQEE